MVRKLSSKIFRVFLDGFGKRVFTRLTMKTETLTRNEITDALNEHNVQYRGTENTEYLRGLLAGFLQALSR